MSDRLVLAHPEFFPAAFLWGPCLMVPSQPRLKYLVQVYMVFIKQLLKSTSANLDLRNVTLYKNAFMTATRSPRLTADNCVVVWCKDGLHTSDQIVQNHATFHRESRLPQHTPSTQHTADPFRNKLNPFEALTSKMRIPRHRVPPK